MNVPVGHSAVSLTLIVLGAASIVRGSNGAEPVTSSRGTVSNQSVALEDRLNGTSPDASDGGVPARRVEVDLPRPDDGRPETPARSGASPAVGHRMPSARDRAGFGEGSAGSYRPGLGALAVVLALVALVFWAVRRWVPAARAADGGVLRVVGRANVTPKHHVSLVQLGHRFVMIGVSPDRLSRLCEVSDPEEVAELAARIAARSGPGDAPFDRQLFREAARYHEPPEEVTGELPPGAGRALKPQGSLTELLGKLRRLQTRH